MVCLVVGGWWSMCDIVICLTGHGGGEQVCGHVPQAAAHLPGGGTRVGPHGWSDSHRPRGTVLRMSSLQLQR